MARKFRLRMGHAAAIFAAISLGGAHSSAQPAPAAEGAKQEARDSREDYRELDRKWVNAMRAGRYAEAVVLEKDRRARWSQLPGQDDAFAYIMYGDYVEAEAILQSYCYPDTQDPQLCRDLGICWLLGEVYLALGDLERAEPLLKKGTTVTDYPEPRPFHSYLALSRMYQEMGARSRAEETLERMRQNGKSDFQQALWELHYGELLLRWGDSDAAEPYLLKAHSALEARHAEDPWYARSLDDLGALLTRKGDMVGAEARLKKALSLQERDLKADHPNIRRTLERLANLYVKQARIEEAVGVRARLAEIYDQASGTHLRRGPERQKRAYTTLLQRDSDAIVSLHLEAAPRSAAAARLALQTILRRKGLLLDAVVESFNAIRRARDPEGEALLVELARLDARLSAALSRGPIDASPEDHQRELRSLEARRQQLELRLAARVEALLGASPREEPATLERVQEAIPEGAALVEIVQYRPYRPFGPPVTSTWGKPRYAAYVLKRRGEVAGVDLGDAAGIDALSAELSRKLGDPRSDPRMAARHLDSAIMQPIRAMLGGTRWLLLSPDGALQLVPFSALVDEQGRELIEEASFTYLTSGRDLLSPEVTAGDPAGEALIVADPTFGSAEAAGAGGEARGRRSIAMEGVRFGRLPGTASEAEAVQKTLGGARLLTGGAATEEALKGVTRPRILHVATHGFFLPDQAASADAGRAPAYREDELHWGESPLLRSGLALAGANARRSTSDKEDGVLTALEISGIDLRGTRLVVLSACETGLGEVRRGDGVYGLRRALVLAGAETQVMSLWSVSDGATRDLMAAYYQGLSRGGGRSEAMRAAQLAVRKERPHPYAWAAFIVSGDGDTLEGERVTPTFPRVVAPGPRGCACRAAPGADDRSSALAALAAALLVAARRPRWHGGGRQAHARVHMRYRAARGCRALRGQRR